MSDLCHFCKENHAQHGCGQMCGTEYCSAECQQKDWYYGHHDMECEFIGVHPVSGSVPDPKSLSVRIVTWNMGDNAKSELDWTNEMSRDWDIIIDKNYDLLFVTLQEDQTSGNFGKAMRNYLRKHYSVYTEQSIPLVPTLKFSVKGYLFVRSSLNLISNIQSRKTCLQSVCTKSTVGISLTFKNAYQFIFMGSHLPINTKKADLGFDERKAAVTASLAKVFDRLRNRNLPYAAFWAGDLNFRLMNNRDQLDEFRRQGGFRNFREQKIDFPPTCKMETSKPGQCDRKESDTKRIPACYVKKRDPSYCDRILYDSSDRGMFLIPLDYKSYGDARAIQKSDHNLLYGKFEVRLK